jgi:hypothetical protein
MERARVCSGSSVAGSEAMECEGKGVRVGVVRLEGLEATRMNEGGRNMDQRRKSKEVFIEVVMGLVAMAGWAEGRGM